MSETVLNLPLLQQWIGRSEESTRRIDLAQVDALAATLDRMQDFVDGAQLPPLWHWIFFWSAAPQAALGSDGHPARGGFLPPVPLPRRMWAGGRLRFHQPVPIGAQASRVSTVLDVTAKEGGSGMLAFVTVQHQIAVDGIVAVTEEHDIVYRGNALPGALVTPGKPAPGVAAATWSRVITPDPVLLFRYSALTFNGHRIHYDRSYVTAVEGYPGLIVHGPLIATLLLDLLHRRLPQARVSAFDFRAVAPLFDTEPFTLCGQPDPNGHTVRLWAQDARGELAMRADATLG